MNFTKKNLAERARRDREARRELRFRHYLNGHGTPAQIKRARKLARMI